jgi:hypothetical protein
MNVPNSWLIIPRSLVVAPAACVVLSLTRCGLDVRILCYAWPTQDVEHWR